MEATTEKCSGHGSAKQGILHLVRICFSKRNDVLLSGCRRWPQRPPPPDPPHPHPCCTWCGRKYQKNRWFSGHRSAAFFSPERGRGCTPAPHADPHPPRLLLRPLDRRAAPAPVPPHRRHRPGLRRHPERHRHPPVGPEVRVPLLHRVPHLLGVHVPAQPRAAARGRAALGRRHDAVPQGPGAEPHAPVAAEAGHAAVLHAGPAAVAARGHVLCGGVLCAVPDACQADRTAQRLPAL